MEPKTLITGFPRIGEKRELKKALESFWSGKSSIEELEKTSANLRKKHWQIQQSKGIDLISCNDFSWYDNMLDTIVMLNAIPRRFQSISDKINRYFAMARGSKDAVAMEMTKWFNTNYHYIVPELSNKIRFSLDASKIIKEYEEAKALGISPKINLIGPLTFLGLSKTENGDDPYNHLGAVTTVYKELLEKVSELDETVYVQLDEPMMVKDPSQKQLELLKETLDCFAAVAGNVRIILTTYFEHSVEAVTLLTNTPLWGIGLDFVHGPDNIKAINSLNGKKLIAGVVDGRNIWINNLEQSLELLNKIAEKTDRRNIIISSSCSLLHVPFGLENEPDNSVNNWMSFAKEKVEETVLLSRLFNNSKQTENDQSLLEQNRATIIEKETSPLVVNNEVLERQKISKTNQREGSSDERLMLQKNTFKLPPLPTTTIGSFPQTQEIRRLRRNFKKFEITSEQYEEGIKKYIDECISEQEEIGLDVLVHGEPERNDMVEYFGEMLEGFHFTTNGWVQSYGSRCVKPPIIYGDVSRPNPMTVKWITYAQSKTKKIMKGMLTGPVTILNWSFVRVDKPRSEVSKQIALALSDEIRDLQTAGIKIIQVDEAAFKEGYPLRKMNIADYETWAVENFRLAVSQAEKGTQIHTHMCYSNFKDIVDTLESMDADVITIETARSGNSLLKIFKESGYKNEIGPGVYDIHSPRIPSVQEFSDQIVSRMEVLPMEQLWINPDCGLKTRKWEEVKPTLTNMVKAVQEIRSA